MSAIAPSSVTDRAWVATRKGLFELRREGSRWRLGRTAFPGEPVTTVLPPDAQGRMLAALNLGHFGVKLHASDDAGATWSEVAAPAYPPQPEDATGPAWKLVISSGLCVNPPLPNTTAFRALTAIGPFGALAVTPITRPELPRSMPLTA